jgi:hypothetical protein
MSGRNNIIDTDDTTCLLCAVVVVAVLIYFMKLRRDGMDANSVVADTKVHVDGVGHNNLGHMSIQTHTGK